MQMVLLVWREIGFSNMHEDLRRAAGKVSTRETIERPNASVTGMLVAAEEVEEA